MLTRRELLKGVAAAGAAVVTADPIGRLLAQDAGTAGRKPNVLFIAIDDLNDWVGCLGGHPDVKTPNLDRLAAKGVLFTRAYCSAPACNPSRASLMTGVLPSTSGVYQNSQPWRPVMQEVTTLQEAFQAAGYEVIGRGKIYHHGRGETYFTEKGWNEYVPKGRDPMPPQRPVNGIPKTAHFDWGPLDADNRDMDDTKVADWCVDQLKRARHIPFFLACGLFRPHLPWYVPRQWFDLYPPDRITLPEINDKDLDDVPEIGRRRRRGIARP